MQKSLYVLIIFVIIFVSGCTQKCPKTSCDTGNCCRTVEGGIGVSGVITKIPCKCPDDTTFVQEDNTAAGGPYNICTCNKKF